MTRTFHLSELNPIWRTTLNTWLRADATEPIENALKMVEERETRPERYTPNSAPDGATA